MRRIVTATRKTPQLVGDEIVAQRGVRGRFFKRARAEMTVQAFPVVIRRVEPDWIHRPAQISHIDMLQATPLGADSPVKHEIFTTGIARFLGRNVVVLEVSRRDTVRIVHMEAPSVWLHVVARETESRVLRALHLL